MEKRIECFRKLLNNWNKFPESEPGNFSLKTKYDRIPHIQANKDNSWYEL